MNLPNKITTFRMVLVVIIDFLLLFPWADVGATVMVEPLFEHGFSIVLLISFVLFLTASISDFFDGYLARKYNLVTTYGKFMDPIADKLLVDSVFIICAIKYPSLVPALVAVIIICRDLLVDALRQIASSKGKILAANMWGKAKTVTQMVALSFVLLNNFPFSLFQEGSSFSYPVTAIICYVASLISAISGILYFTKNLDVFRD
ncbi:MAG: CDP-diacylglycerol--glycerol-3-phosphate 3-phosphatidyltransferase [Bacillales bacterium]|nr:CDP-diacylglycerol--glycerol-3-phosphate 3-phosphatidyltransferase [Bacillales bacterium]